MNLNFGDDKVLHDTLWEAAQELGGSWQECQQRMPRDRQSGQQLLRDAMKSIEEGLLSGEYESDPETDQVLANFEDLLTYLDDYGDDYFQNN